VNYLATLTHGRDILSCRVVELSDAGARIELVSETAVVAGPIRLACPQIGDIGGAVVCQKGAVVGLKLDPASKDVKKSPREVAREARLRRGAA
jgi:hypothetical protein